MPQAWEAKNELKNAILKPNKHGTARRDPAT
jgi:hypothetical protein